MPEILDILSRGGAVAPFLLLAAAVLWYALGWRWLCMRHAGPPDPLSAARAGALHGVRGRAAEAALAVAHLPQPRPHLEAAVAPLRAELARHATLVRTVVLLAPLAGLLGTVTGMIETFDSLAEMALFSRSGGIAGGISEALFSTQMGLAVAIPGLIAGRLLESRQAHLQDDIDRLVDALAAGEGA